MTRRDSGSRQIAVQELLGPRLEDVRAATIFVTVGICATGRAENLPALLDAVTSESSVHFGISRIVLVASECGAISLEYARQAANNDPRILLVEEEKRLGKWEAINQIVSRCRGDYLLFINSDALPEAGAIGLLVKHAMENPRFGVVSASPFLVDRENNAKLSSVEELIWSIHNESSLELNHLGLSNHASDEMMLLRSDLVEPLPSGVVNDGALVASRVRKRGYFVGFSKIARVRISVPSQPFDLITQRRRILFGHIQVRRLIGEAPRTLESMLFFSPLLSIGILARALGKRPTLLFSLPAALVLEMISAMLALFDASVSSKRHSVWKRYDN